MIPFIDRNPTEMELEKFRLVLSTYQDGSGMLAANNGLTLPGWRDFERSIALCLNGIALESKSIFDVLVQDPKDKTLYYGISCKMRKTLRQVEKDGRVTIELSNAAGEFWDLLKLLGINQQNYGENAQQVGKALIKRVENWHNTTNQYKQGHIDIQKCFFLSLQYDTQSGFYQLFKFPLELPAPDQIKWSIKGRHLIGTRNQKTIIEWYGLSGGQLKFYPHYSSATWMSNKFILEPLPDNLEPSILKKARLFWPEKWKAIG